MTAGTLMPPSTSPLNLALLLAALLPALGVAQPAAVPDVDRRHRDDLRESFRIERKIENARQSFGGVQIESPQPALPPTEASDEKVLELKQVVFSPPPKAIPLEIAHAAAARYVGTRVSMRDLYQLLGEIDKRYDEAGVIGRAVLPAQDVQAGIVTIQLVEAHVGKVTAQGGRRYRAPYVLKSVPLRRGDGIKVKGLEQSLLRYNSMHESRLQAELVAGTEFGETDVVLNVTEPARFSGTVYADNSGRKSTGRLRGGVFAAMHSILGRDEVLSLNADHSEGWDGINAAYRQPITRWGTFANLGCDWSEFGLVDGLIESLGVDGDSSAWNVGLSQLLLARQHWSLTTDVGFADRRSSTRFEGTELLAERLQLASLGFTFRWQGQKGMWELNQVSWHANDRGVQSEDFFFVTASLLGVRWFRQDWSLVGRISGQWVGDEIISSQQFQIGGSATVRGFEEGLLFGESGGAATVEVRRNLVKKEKHAVEALAFLDYGGVYSEDSPTKAYRSLASVGVGLNVSAFRYLGARVGYGYPLSGLSDIDDVLTPRRGRVHVMIQATY